jgi:hypothetical protein
MRFEQAKIDFSKWCEKGLDHLYQKQVIEGDGSSEVTGQDLLNQAAFCLENTMLSASGMFDVAKMVNAMVSRLPVSNKKELAGILAAELPLPALSLSSLPPLPPSAILQLSNNNNNNSSSSSSAAASEPEKPHVYVPETQQPGSLYNQPPSMSQQQQEPTPMETQETVLLQDKDNNNNTLSTAPATYDSFTKEDDTQEVLEKIMNPLLKISLTNNSSQETKTVDLTATAPIVGKIPLQAARDYARFSLNVRKGGASKTSLSSTTTVVQSTTVTETSSSSSAAGGQVSKKV